MGTYEDRGTGTTRTAGSFDDWETPGAGRGVLPEIEAMTPGPELGQVLSGLDRGVLNGHEMVEVVAARSRQISWLQAELAADITELAHCPPGDAASPPERSDLVDEFLSDEVGLALTLTRRSADYLVGVSLALCERLPNVWKALAAGAIDLARAKVFCRETSHLEPDEARLVCDTLLGDASELTTGQLGARLRKHCLTADPDSAKKRYEEGVEERRLVTEANPDGTADLLGCQLPPDRVTAITRLIDRLARRLDDGRSIDQKRADIFLDLLEGNHHDHHAGGSPRGVVDIEIDLPTLAGLADNPALIPGWGPVIADIARQALERQPDGEWRIRVVDPDAGAILWNGTTRRRPTARQRRWVEANWPTCSYPGCRMPATQSDIDHNRSRADGGSTQTRNLTPFCRHHHRLKHHRAWTIRRLARHLLEWTTPHGHTYTNGPSP